ncbi:ferrous iron transport protein A [Helicobacter didelphidarum]|uniref:Ferrous iron transport protein A n=1 Tax=Helicobacter didelphidarum TaxID=2040648 RepID=A0A3D8IPS1_9HELI|nr:FeoA family protein [Helicobacter didelphidarum]RDU66980.1 ferrous iron transport protein A [Helicobacter didelphidarum]
MTLIDSAKGNQYYIKGICCQDEDLLQRFYSMGIYEGNMITLEHISAMHNTYSISVYGTQIALRRGEAQCIEIELR